MTYARGTDPMSLSQGEKEKKEARMHEGRFSVQEKVIDLIAGSS